MTLKRVPPKPSRALAPADPWDDAAVGVIIKGVPVPEYVRKPKYPFNDMQVGDHVRYPIEYANNVRAALRAHQRKRGGKFITRTVGTFMCIWRES